MRANKNVMIRQRFIEAMLIQHGCIQRENIMDTFDVALACASRDLQTYKKLNPGVVFSYVHLTNVTHSWFEPTPGLLSMPAAEYLKMLSTVFDAPDFSAPGSVTPHRSVGDSL